MRFAKWTSPLKKNSFSKSNGSADDSKKMILKDEWLGLGHSPGHVREEKWNWNLSFLKFDLCWPRLTSKLDHYTPCVRSKLAQLEILRGWTTSWAKTFSENDVKSWILPIDIDIVCYIQIWPGANFCSNIIRPKPESCLLIHSNLTCAPSISIITS